MARKDLLLRKQEIEEWIAEKRSKAYICRQLQCKPSTLETYLSLLGIIYKGNQGNKGHKESLTRKPALELLKSTWVNSHKLKIRLLEDGIFEKKCYSCYNIEWLGNPIKLELHHIDGNHFNNALVNLTILCPNCHAMIPKH